MQAYLTTMDKGDMVLQELWHQEKQQLFKVLVL